MSGLPNNLIAASLVNAHSSLTFVRDSLRAGDVRDHAVRALAAVEALMANLDVAVPVKQRDPERTYEHDPLCDDDGWNHFGPCVIETDPSPT